MSTATIDPIRLFFDPFISGHARTQRKEDFNPESVTTAHADFSGTLPEFGVQLLTAVIELAVGTGIFVLLALFIASIDYFARHLLLLGSQSVVVPVLRISSNVSMSLDLLMFIMFLFRSLRRTIALI